MGRNEDFDDGDDLNGDGPNGDSAVGRPEATYPSGPVPPHERIWRHPSELGFAAVSAADAAPVNIGRTGRSLLGISSIGGAFLIAILFVALQPTSPEPDAQDVIALTNSELRVATLDHPGLISMEPNTGIPDPAPRRVNDAVGIMLPNGQFLITTMSAITEVDAINVRLTGGRTVSARVVQTYPKLSVAVLSVSENTTSAALTEIDVMSIVPRGEKFSKGQVVMALVDVPRQLTVSEKIDDVLVSLRSTSMSVSDLARVSEGAPIVDKSGRLIGLCTHAAGVLGFIPFTEIEAALATWITETGASEQTKQR